MDDDGCEDRARLCVDPSQYPTSGQVLYEGKKQCGHIRGAHIPKYMYEGERAHGYYIGSGRILVVQIPEYMTAKHQFFRKWSHKDSTDYDKNPLRFKLDSNIKSGFSHRMNRDSIIAKPK